MNRRLTRRRCLLGIALLLGIVAAVLVLREARYLARLTPHVRARMPAHFRIPYGLAPEVRDEIEGCYAPIPDDRWQATHSLGNLGPAAAPAVPWLVALLADEDPALGAVLSNPSGTPPPAPFDWSLYEKLPIIGPLIKLFTRRGQSEHHFYSSSGACAALGEIGEPAVEPLIRALKDDLPRVRKLAVVALGNIADPRAIEPLAALLDDPDKRPRMAAALALGQFRDERAVAHLSQALLNPSVVSGENDVREAAGQALAAMGPMGWPPVMQALKARSRDMRAAAIGGLQQWLWARRVAPSQETGACPSDDWGNCTISARRMADKGTREVVHALVAALGDPDEDVANVAAYGLKHVEDSVVIDGLVAATNHPSANVRISVIEALGNHKGPKVAEALASLLNDPDTRQRAAYCLAKTGDKRAWGPLIEQLKKDEGCLDAGEAIEAIKAMGGPRAVPALIDLLNRTATGEFRLFDTPNAHWVDLAALALAEQKDVRAIPDLVLTCEAWPDSTAVRAALVSFGPAAVEPLLKTLQDGQSVEGPIRALAEIGDRRALEPLRGILKGDDPVSRLEGAAALVRLGDSQAIEAVLAALLGQETRLAGVKALGYLKDKRAIEPLREIFSKIPPPKEGRAQVGFFGSEPDPNETPRNAVLAALLRIGDPQAVEQALNAHGYLQSTEAGQELFRIIAKMGPAAVPPLEKALSHPNLDFRASAAALLFLIDDPKVLAALRTTFSMQDIMFVRNFWPALWRDEGWTRTEPLLEILASHKDLELRREAIRWLMMNRDPRVIPALRRAAASDICPSVREAAWEAIEELTGEERPATVPPQWLDEENPLERLLGDKWY